MLLESLQPAPSARPRGREGECGVKQAIAAAFRARFPSPQQMGAIEAADLEIDVLTDADALVVGRLVHTVGDRTRRGVFTVHLRKFGGDWFIVSDHFSTLD